MAPFDCGGCTVIPHVDRTRENLKIPPFLQKRKCTIRFFFVRDESCAFTPYFLLLEVDYSYYQQDQLVVAVGEAMERCRLD